MAQIIVSIPLNHKNKPSFDSPKTFYDELEEKLSGVATTDSYQAEESTGTTAIGLSEVILKRTQKQAIEFNNISKDIKNEKNMKELNLTEKLKNAPEGLKLYSPLIGDVTLVEVLEPCNYPISVDGIDGNYRFASNGRYCNINHGECMLFPSEGCRDWNKFQCPKIGDVVKLEGYNFTCRVSKLYSDSFDAVNDEKSYCANVSYRCNFEIIEERKFKIGNIVELNNKPCLIVNYFHGYQVISPVDNLPLFLKHKELEIGKIISKEELRDKYCLMLDEKNNFVRWMPKKEDTYYFTVNPVSVSKTSNHENPSDRYRINQFNCFPTEKIAKQVVEQMKELFKNFNPNK